MCGWRPQTEYNMRWLLPCTLNLCDISGFKGELRSFGEEIRAQSHLKHPKARFSSQNVVDSCLHDPKKKHIKVPSGKKSLRNWSHEPKQDDGSSGFVCKPHIIKVSHPYLSYPSLFKRGFSRVIMRFSIHLCICFQLRCRKNSLGCPTDRGYSSLSL